MELIDDSTVKVVCELAGGCLRASGNAITSLGIFYGLVHTLNGSKTLIDNIPLILDTDNVTNQKLDAKEVIYQLLPSREQLSNFGYKTFYLTLTVTAGVGLKIVGKKVSSQIFIQSLERILSK